MMKCEMAESVKKLMNERMRSERLKRKFEKSVSERLSGGDLKKRLREESTGEESRESMKDVKTVKSMKNVKAVKSMKNVKTVKSMKDVKNVNSEEEMKCECREITFAKEIIDAMRRLRKKNVKGRVKTA